jgi:hypothetical protein
MNGVAFFSFAAVLCYFVQNWYMGKGRLAPTYLWGLAGSGLCLVVDVALVVKDVTNYGILAFALLAVWQIAMCLRGARRELSRRVQ